MEKLMLVSDYDGTFKSDIKNLKINIEAINEFRKKGNLLAISTGRAYRSIRKECDRYNIKYDYLFCNNGLVLFDKNDNIIYEKTIDTETLKKLVSLIYSIVGIKNIEYYDSYRQTNLRFDDNIIEIFLQLKLINNFNQIQKQLNEKLPSIKIIKYLTYVLIRNEFDKSSGLEILSQQLSNEIPRENIITVGDNYNDLTMLKDFNGYKMLSSYPFLYGKGIKTTKEVHTLIKKLEKKN